MPRVRYLGGRDATDGAGARALRAPARAPGLGRGGAGRAAGTRARWWSARAALGSPVATYLAARRRRAPRRWSTTADVALADLARARRSTSPRTWASARRPRRRRSSASSTPTCVVEHLPGARSTSENAAAIVAGARRRRSTAANAFATRWRSCNAPAARPASPLVEARRARLGGRWSMAVVPARTRRAYRCAVPPAPARAELRRRGRARRRSRASSARSQARRGAQAADRASASRWRRTRFLQIDAARGGGSARRRPRPAQARACAICGAATL